MKSKYVFKPEQQSETDLFMGQVYAALKETGYDIVSINQVDDKSRKADTKIFRIEFKPFDYLHRHASDVLRHLGLEIVGFRVGAFSDFGKSTWVFVEERWPGVVPEVSNS